DGNGFLPYQSVKVLVKTTLDFRRGAKTEGTNRQLARGIAEMMTVDAAVKGTSLREYYEQEGHPEHELNPENEQQAIEGFRESVLEKRKHGGEAQEHPQWGRVGGPPRC